MNVNNNDILQIEQNNKFIFSEFINNYPILYFGIYNSLYFKVFIVSSPKYFNASATKQLETLFIKLFREYFGKELIQNIKVERNIHFYNNKDDIDDLQNNISFKRVYICSAKKSIKSIKEIYRRNY